MMLERKIEILINEEPQDIIEDNPVEEAALEAIRETKISLQMIVTEN